MCSLAFAVKCDIWQTQFGKITIIGFFDSNYLQIRDAIEII